MQWRWIREEPAGVPVASGARNMAVDSTLLASVAGGAPPAVRFYRWSPACLSLGRNQAAIGLYDRDRASRLGFDIVRRPTGGSAVLHDAELTYSIVAPAALLGGPRAGYRLIHRAIANGLTHLGVRTELALSSSPVAQHANGSDPCFAHPMGGEVVVSGRKLVGSAQRTERRTVLQHGSILLEGSQARVDELRLQPAAPGPNGAITLAELLGSVPAWNRMVQVLADAIERVFSTRLALAPLDPAELALASRLEARYRDDAWTWRR